MNTPGNLTLGKGPSAVWLVVTPSETMLEVDPKDEKDLQELGAIVLRELSDSSNGVIEIVKENRGHT